MGPLNNVVTFYCDVRMQLLEITTQAAYFLNKTSSETYSNASEMQLRNEMIAHIIATSREWFFSPRA